MHELLATIEVPPCFAGKDICLLQRAEKLPGDVVLYPRLHLGVLTLVVHLDSNTQQPADNPDHLSGSGLPEEPPPARKAHFRVEPHLAEKVNKLLSLANYAKRWPLIPKHELWASSVAHPHRPEWRWLLHTRRLPDLCLDEHRCAPLVKVCHDCGHALSAEPTMPRYALANDNWIGRVPFPLRPGGDPLRDMEIRSLARARVCVNKIIAEPDKKGPPDQRQRGLVGNFICFPQAKVDVLRSKELPAPAAEAERFLGESVVIALAGADVEDLSNAKWANVRKGEYMDAGRFFTSHSVSYADMTCNQRRADEEMDEAGSVPNSVRQLAVPIEVSERLKYKLDGPADTGDAGHEHESCVNIDGQDCISEHEADEEQHAAIPDPEFPPEALPAMSFCADSVNSGDLDELQAVRKVHAELEALQESVRKEATEGVTQGRPRRRLAKQLQQSAKGMLDDNLASKIIDHNEALDALEKVGAMPAPCGVEAYAQGTATKPLSMYSPQLWSMSFPDTFPCLG